VPARQFTPDSNTLATASTDGTAMLWNLTGLNHLRDHAVERACFITGHGLDRDQWELYRPGLLYQDTCPA
jgi:WD40 repeat protein